jgi:dolichol-phosphate mannosyltransferase
MLSQNSSHLQLAPLLVPTPKGPYCLEIAPLERQGYFSLVVPTYNEAKNVVAMVESLTELLDRACPDAYEIILVDDDSPDRTWEIAQNLNYPQLRVMRRTEERGLATAVIRGWQVARGDIIGVIDGDCQHPPAVLGKLLTAIGTGADLAVASRNVEGGGISDWGVVRRSLSRGAQLLGLMIAPGVVGRVSDPMSGYFLLRRSALTDVTLNPKGYKILLEVLGRGRIEMIAEVGYVFQERQAGESKVTLKQYVDYIQHLFKLRHQGRLRAKLPIGRLLRFGLVGFSGLAVDMAILFLLHDARSPLGLGWALTRSSMIASEIAIMNNFWWNDRWTFRDLSQGQTKRGQWLKRFLKFNLICLMGLILKVLILNVLFNFLQINPYLANLGAIVLVTIWNFWINLKLNWRVTSSQ